MKTLIISTLLCFSAMASDLDKRPLPFPHQGGHAVFADFKSAHYEITYDINKKIAYARAEIELETAEAGNPIFDSHQDPTLVSLNGITTTADLVKTPSDETTVRVVGEKVEAGNHRLIVELPIVQLVEFTKGGVKSAFWLSDLTERGYLERYLPTNFLFDRIPTSFHVKFIGGSETQKIYTNGVLEKVSSTEYKIIFPDGFNSSCHYFHTVVAGTMVEKTFIYKSNDGREIPAIIYVKNDGDQDAYLESLKTKTITIMDELENDYGPFLHPSLTIYIAGRGGMEYSGATMTSESALGHELFHSYFARGVMPSDGNSGWIDEALARWRDNGYQSITTLFGTSNMANHAYYNRVTDRLAYSFGERFIALMEGKLTPLGGLKPFLKELVAQKAFAPLNTQEFILEMNDFFGLSFDRFFKKYLFGEGQKSMKINIRPSPFKENHIHHELSLSELQELL
jgi:hypothetical protein